MGNTVYIEPKDTMAMYKIILLFVLVGAAYVPFGSFTAAVDPETVNYTQSVEHSPMDSPSQRQAMICGMQIEKCMENNNVIVDKGTYSILEISGSMTSGWSFPGNFFTKFCRVFTVASRCLKSLGSDCQLIKNGSLPHRSVIDASCKESRIQRLNSLVACMNDVNLQRFIISSYRTMRSGAFPADEDINEVVCRRTKTFFTNVLTELKKKCNADGLKTVADITNEVGIEVVFKVISETRLECVDDISPMIANFPVKRSTFIWSGTPLLKRFTSV